MKVQHHWIFLSVLQGLAGKSGFPGPPGLPVMSPFQKAT